MMTRMTQGTRAVIYCRQSLDMTGQGAAVARQEEACRGLATARGWDVVSVQVDNSVSASTGRSRPAWDAVLGMVERGEVDVILAYHLDRITRTMTDLEHLITTTQARGVGVATATGDIDLTTDTGRMVARILAAVARAEVERKGARQMLANQQRAEQGEHKWSHRPFGYEKDGTLRESEAEHLREAYRLVLAGHRQSSIVSAWNEQGIRTTLGGLWSTQTMGNLLRNPRNAGVLVYQGQEMGRGNWEPIVDEDTFRVAVARLRQPGRRGGRGRGTSTALLVGIATCEQGCNLFTSTDTRTGERMYSCQSGHVSAPVEQTEGIVLRRVAEALEDTDQAAVWASVATEDGEARARLGERLAVLTERLEGLSVDYADGVLDRAQMQAASARLRDSIAQVEADLSELDSHVRPSTLDHEAWFEQFYALPLPEQRQQVRAVLSSIAIKRRGRGSRVPFGSEHVLTERATP